MIAKVLINTSVKKLNKVYDYLIPKELEQNAEIGKRVEISFGASRKSTDEGIIVKIIDEVEKKDGEKKYKLKSIISMLDDISYIDSARLKLAKYIAYMYFCNVYEALKLMLPPGTTSKNSKKNFNSKLQSAIRLIKSKENILQDIDSLVITSAKHIQLLTFLMENEFTLVSDIVEGLKISKAIISTVVKNGYIEIYKTEIEEEIDIKQGNITDEKKLTEEQQNAVDKIGKYIYEEEYKKVLLFGVTGSGKTEVYLSLIKKILMQGKKAIVLVPEISLTYQTVSRFVERFGQDVAILHSKMTISKRKEEYKKIKEGKINIVIGARSAIFAPIENIGLVIIDEEHDSSYYSQTSPKYSTKDIATYICKENNAVLLLGTATPEISTYYKAENKEIEICEMKNRPGDSVLPKIYLTDMKDEKVIGNFSIFSNKLKEEILKNIENGEQTMIFLNRRGYNSYLTCQDCGYTFICPNCDVAMTYHKTNNLLLCHYCSHVEKNVSKCFKCGSDKLSSGTIGTEKLEEELKAIYPEISTLRMDADTTILRDSQEKILNKFRNEKINILVGTQMISKGHDFSNVTLVGILGVDSMISMNDYLSSEKAFSNILQVAGRAGRSTLPGRVIIQTNDTENYILKAVENNNYMEFYEKEIEYRKNFGYPPFLDIVVFELASKELQNLKESADKLYKLLLVNDKKMYNVFSPKSPFVQKVNNKFRINILLKTKITKTFYVEIYKILNEYEKIKLKDVNMTISRNPNSIK